MPVRMFVLSSSTPTPPPTPPNKSRRVRKYGTQNHHPTFPQTKNYPLTDYYFFLINAYHHAIDPNFLLLEFLNCIWLLEFHINFQAWRTFSTLVGKFLAYIGKKKSFLHYAYLIVRKCARNLVNCFFLSLSGITRN